MGLFGVIFPSLEFALFFAIVLPASWLLMSRPRIWKPFIIVASYVFYGYADPHFVLLLAFCTVWNQGLAVLLHRVQPVRVRKAVLAVAIAGDLGVLGWFKYYAFFAGNVATFTARVGLPMPLPLLQVALPIAISFFTFMAMSYVIDVYRRQQDPVAAIDFALYLSFFPHLIAGPIVRVSELVPQFAAPRDPRRVEAVRAFALICGGLVKKVVIADTIATQLVDPVFGSPSLHSRVDVIAAVYGYAVQIYCDFSAYSDMAIGIALLLGFQFPQNFNQPYTAVTLQDFWHRWHMSLSRWLRDYLYISLGGNRKGRTKTYRNLILTFVLGGLWHGAAWNFVLWGGMHGAGLAVERWWSERTGHAPIRFPWLRWFITFNLVCLAWVFFRASGMATVGELWGQLVYGGGSTVLTTPLLLLIGLGIVMQFAPPRIGTVAREIFGRLGPLPQGVLLAIVLIGTGVLVTGQGVAPFIYYRF
jgi:D-alanyl-lipoteichoic acid acyltransferase DltB (MBOAT superfamily)